MPSIFIHTIIAVQFKFLHINVQQLILKYWKGQFYYYNFILLKMPQAKKNKVVSLTQVKPKTKDHKEMIVEKARMFLNKYKYVYVLSFENMSTSNFQNLREDVADSKFLMGKNRVLSVAFGTEEENSFRPNSYKLSEYMKGHCTLFFTNKKPQQCQQLFNSFEEDEFATGGTLATETIILEKGFDSLKKFAHSLEPRLRQLGLPTRLVNQQIQLTSDYLLCQQGKQMTVNQCKLLKLFGKKMSRLKFQIKAWYDGKKVHA